MIQYSTIPIQKRLAILFFATGILPLLIIGFYGSRLAMDAQMIKSFEHLNTVQGLKRDHIERVFRQHENAFRSMTESHEILNFVKLMIEKDRLGRHETADTVGIGASGPEFLEKICTRTMRKIMYTRNCHDILIVSADHGRILISAAGADTAGACLTEDLYSGSTMTDVWQRVIDSGSRVIADFSPHAPSGGIQSAFYGYPVNDPSGKCLAVLIVQISPSFVNAIIYSRQAWGETSTSFLIKKNQETGLFELRSDFVAMGDERYVAGYVPGTIPGYWEEVESRDFQGGQGIYPGGNGQEVLAAYNRLNINGLNWYLISRIDRYEVEALVRRILHNTVIVSGILLALISIGAGLFSRDMSRSILKHVRFARDIANGKLDKTLSVKHRDELGELTRALNRTAINIRKTIWLEIGGRDLNAKIRGINSTHDLAQRLVDFVVKHLDAAMAAFYIMEDDRLNLHADYSFSDKQGEFTSFAPGEGIVGQAGLEQKIIFYNHVSDNIPVINYGTGEKPLNYYLAAPLIFEEKTIAVLLIGSDNRFTSLKRRFLYQNDINTTTLLNAAISTQKIQELLEQARQQKKDLFEKNQALERQTRALRESEAALQSQQEELRVINEELEKQTNMI